MKQFLSTILAVFLISNAQAQSITGKIKAVNGSAIEFASISILNTNKTTLSDKEGNFSFKGISPGTYQLSTSSLGFASKLNQVRVNPNKATELTITLNEQNQPVK